MSDSLGDVSIMRIAVIADIHGNLLALEAVLADSARFAPDMMVDLGDCISGPLWPRETFEKLETLALPTVRGNHDRKVAGTSPESMWASDRIAYEALSSAQRAKLGAIPFTLEIAPGIKAFHASPLNDESYLLDMVSNGKVVRAPVAGIVEKLSGVEARLVLCAHSHRQELVTLPSGQTVVNPGSVGCPGYEDTRHPAHVMETGAPHARYAIIDVSDGQLKDVTFRAVSYNHEAAALQALSFGAIGWAHALRTGFMQIV
jgi:predicted phosphodiesterase